MNVLAIDPGPEKSAWIYATFGMYPPPRNRPFVAIIGMGIDDNRHVMDRIMAWQPIEPRVGIECVACYGMAVGKEVFETCIWIGRFIEQLRKEPIRVYRRDVKMHLCNSVRAKDGNVRQALIDKYGKPGTKKNKGDLYGVSSHLWAALGVADYLASL